MFILSIKNWIFSALNKDRASLISEKWNVPYFLAVLFDVRGITEEKDIKSILSEDIILDDPMTFIDMDKAVARIKKAVDSFERICVYGDYDADGVTSTAILYSYLSSCGADALYYIPDRENDGYGLNNNAIDRLKDEGVKLIITVDNGIVSVNEVNYANSIGVDVVITDHHRTIDTLPNACAVVDPHRKDCKSRFKDLAGCGVAFKLIMALEGENLDINELIANYSDLVAIGTIADVVPLKDENRFLVKTGLEHIENTDRVGLKSLLDDAGLYGRKLNTSNIAFALVPRINASGRLGSSNRAVKLLLSGEVNESDDISVEIGGNNRERQKIEQEIQKEVDALLKNEPERQLDRVLIIDGKNFHHGVIGIVASKITEKYGKPSIIISVDGELAKGSGRSIEGFSLHEAICACSEYLTKFGGHPMAVGLNMKSKDIEPFKKAINEYAKEKGQMPDPVLNIDCKINPAALSTELVDQINLLEPFGSGNPKPIFALCRMTLSEIHPVSAGKHLRLKFKRADVCIYAMKFFTQADNFEYQVGDVLDIAVTIDKSEYNGKESLSIIIKDIKLSSSDLGVLLENKRLYESIKRKEEVSIKEIEDIVPTRDEFAYIYRYIRKNNHIVTNLQVLENRLKNKISTVKIALILDIMDELKLINLEKEADVYKISINSEIIKVNLEDSKILQHLNLMIKKVAV